MQDMRDLYKAYSAVHDTTIKEELDNSKDQISAMNFGQLTEGDLLEVCEEIVEGLFQYGCDLDTVHEVVGSVMESTVEGELPAHRKEKIVRISEAFDKTFEKVASRAERNCEEEFLKYRTNKPLNEKWQNKLNNEVGNEKLHAALIHEDRETIKGGLIEMISKVIEEKKDSSYLETDMKKREKNNEKARKDMEKVPGQKNPHFEEVSTLRKGWGDAYASIYEKKLDPVGQEDGDIDNDGDKDSSDKYLAKRRKAIAKSMGKDVKEGKMSDEDIKKRVGYTSDETRQKRLDKIKVKFMKKEEVEQIDEISQKTATKAFAQRATNEYETDSDSKKSDAAKSRIVKKFGKKAGDHAERAAHRNTFGRSNMPPMSKEETEVEEGYQELSRDKRNKMFRKAGNLSRTALQGGDKGTEAHKKSGKIIKALNKDAEKHNRNDVKNEEVEKVDEILAPAIAGTLGAVTGKKDRKVKKAVGAGSGAAIGGMLGGPLGAAIGGLAGGTIASQYEPKGVTFSETELKKFEEIAKSWED